MAFTRPDAGARPGETVRQNGRPMKTGQSIQYGATSAAAVLQVQGLCFAYPQRELFAQLGVRLWPGVTLVRGGDGCGKTTLLQLLAGAVAADAGTLQVRDIALHQQPLAYRQQVFWADPRATEFEQTKVRNYFNALPSRYPTFDWPLLGELIEGLALAPHLHKPLYMLSTGSKRKVWLAAAFACGAAVTLVDEPFAALDQVSVAFIRVMLQEAAGHASRAWVVAHYESLGEDIALATVIDLGD